MGTPARLFQGRKPKWPPLVDFTICEVRKWAIHVEFIVATDGQECPSYGSGLQRQGLADFR